MQDSGVTIIMVISGVKQLIAKLIYDRGLSLRDGHYLTLQKSEGFRAKAPRVKP
jgi:hypothetical protein